jgi:hypothetical protein
MKNTHADHRQSGFSLIELVVVIFIIGLIASIVVPNLGFITGEADNVKNKHNAQSVLLAYSTGDAAGVVWPDGDVATKVAAVIAGKKPSSGPFATMIFQATLNSENAAGTYPFIGLRPSGELFFDSTGGQNPAGH